MLRPVNPAKSLVRPAARTKAEDAVDVHLEVIPPRGQSASTVGKAKVSGRSMIINRKGP